MFPITHQVCFGIMRPGNTNMWFITSLHDSPVGSRPYVYFQQYKPPLCALNIKKSRSLSMHITERLQGNVITIKQLRGKKNCYDHWEDTKNFLNTNTKEETVLINWTLDNFTSMFHLMDENPFIAVPHVHPFIKYICQHRWKIYEAVVVDKMSVYMALRVSRVPNRFLAFMLWHFHKSIVQLCSKHITQ